MSLTFLVLNTIITQSANGSPTQQNMNLVTNIDVSAIAFSMATNLLATLLIAYKLWLVNISCDVNDCCLFLTGTTENLPEILVCQ
jgi:hypothetical protein